MKRLFSILVIMLVLSCVVTLTSCFIGNGGSTTTTTKPNDGPAQDHKHSYTATITEPTCTESGYTTFACSCGISYKANDTDPTGHTYGSELTPPTCTQQGYTTYTCACGDSYVDDYVEIDPTNHTPGEWVVDKVATCIENGMNSKYCTACGEKTDSTVTFSTGHVISITVVQALSCTEDGIIRHECTVDGCDYFYEITTKAEHNMQLEEKVDATCTSDGYILYGCTKCDHEEITVMYGGHSYTSEITKEPTQKQVGEMTYTCAYCNDSYTEEIAMLKQGVYALLIEDTAAWRTNTNAELLNSLVNSGYIAYWDRLHSSKLDSADLSKYGIILIANDQNSSTYKNMVANKNNLQIFARDGGVLLYGACDAGWSAGNIGAALLEGVEKDNYYSYRNYVVNADHPIVTGALTDGKSLTNELLYHNYTSHTYFTNLPEGANIILQDANGNPTLVEYEVGSGHVIVSGLTWEHNAKYEYNDKGSYSNTAYDDLIIYATTLINSCEHEYKENGSQEASCTESGYTLYTCALCGFTYKDNIVKPLGHNVEKWTQAVAPTCTKEGEEIGACSVCGEKQTRKVEAFGHTEGEWIVDSEPTCTAAGSQHLTCETCGETISTEAIPTLDHTESEWIVDKEATKTEEGIKHIECTVCGITLKTEVIDTLSSEGLEFALNEDGQSYSVIGIGTCTDINVVIPAKYKGLPVTGISDDAFYHCDLLTSIEIPNSVMSIGIHAFYYCPSLTSVEIPDSVTSIGYAAFSSCRSLVNIEIPNSVTSIGDWAFSSCISLTSIEIPNSVTSIGDLVFSSCTSLTSIVIPDSVTSIGDHAFKDCRSLTSVVIPDSVTSIGDSAFYNCISITSIEISNSVTSIGNYAFDHCESIISIEIPNSVTSIGWDAFRGCKNLTIYCEAENKPQGWDSYWNSDNRPVVWGYKMPSEGLEFSLNGDGQTYSVTGIGTCTDTNVIIPSTYKGLPVTAIGWGAFQGCISIENLTIPDSITEIGCDAFYKCSSMKSIFIPVSVYKISYPIFCDCYSLTIYCEIESKPDGWSERWNAKDWLGSSFVTTVWGYTGE